MENLNLDFSQTVHIDTEQQPWLPSPMQGVERKPLARQQQESGHATSIVRYLPGARFKRHLHPLGEEILVLSGTFSDEHGNYGPGSYIRNPPGSAHAPFSEQGCTLFVKLNQFDKQDSASVRIDTQTTLWQPGQGGLQVMPLHDYAGQHTALVKWPAGERFLSHKHFGGEEILVLSGCFEDEHGSYNAMSWLRSPHLSQHQPFVQQDTIIFVKVGHLPVS
ncbi:cupin [Shewanella sp. Scap07]|uniref:cupin domain-containing protein n=1 Tax=Shewanella sp. Scap07 TaxID=2589987 RepID=UPI0015BB0DB4|nr:cupin domain-containing protein [Shewanella sp. Scap07]QLE86259.1 cupin [Shewanella sp. Scap07]